MDHKENAEQEPIVIIVSGPNASGKTAIVGLIAEVLVHTGGFKNINVAYAEQSAAGIREKMGALIGGQMDQVRDHPIMITECGPLNVSHDYIFQGHYRPTTGTMVYKWTGNNVEGTFSTADMHASREVARKMMRGESHVFGARPPELSSLYKPEDGGVVTSHKIDSVDDGSCFDPACYPHLGDGNKY